MKAIINVEEKYMDNVKTVIAHTQNDMDSADGTIVEFDSENFNFIHELIHSAEVKKLHTGTLLDKALVVEMGKAYRERYEMATKAGDEAAKNKAYGAMMVLKKIMEMVE